MTTQEKLNLILNTTYNNVFSNDYEPRIEERDGDTYVLCAYSDEMVDIEDIELISYNGQDNIPIAKWELEDNFVKCAGCGEWQHRFDDSVYYTEDTNNYFCENCGQDLHWCEHCEEWYEYDDEVRLVNTRHGEEWWCEHCRDYDAFWSDRSHEYYESAYYDMAEVLDERECEMYTMTRDEAHDNYYYCEDCDRFFINEAFNHGAERCIFCAGTSVDGAYINTYHTSKNSNSLQFFGVSKFVNWCGIGFELEIDTTYGNYRENQQKLLNELKEKFGDRITFESDSSLDYGFEIISAPHTKDEMNVVDWAELMQICKDYGYRSHDTNTCGLHFHVSGYMFGATKEKQHDTIAKVIAFYERYFDDFVKLSRRGSRSSVERWANTYGVNTNDMASCKAKCRLIVESYARGSSDRYKAINLTNRSSDGLFKTVEFRINRGTLNYNTFRASYNLILTMIKNAKKIDWNDSDFFNPKRWFKGCEANTYAYINKRNAFEGIFYLANANAQTEYTQETQA